MNPLNVIDTDHQKDEAIGKLSDLSELILQEFSLENLKKTEFTQSNLSALNPMEVIY